MTWSTGRRSCLTRVLLCPPFLPGLAGISVRAREVSFPFFFWTLECWYQCTNDSSLPADCDATRTWEQTARPFHCGQLWSHLNSPSAFPGLTKCGRSCILRLATMPASGVQPGAFTTCPGVFKRYSAFCHMPSTVDAGMVVNARVNSSALMPRIGNCTNKSSTTLLSSSLWPARLLREVKGRCYHPLAH